MTNEEKLKIKSYMRELKQRREALQRDYTTVVASIKENNLQIEQFKAVFSELEG